MGILDSATLLLRATSYAGTAAWMDLSGNGLNAQFGDGSTSSTFPVYAGDHFTFDGSQYFEIGDNALLDFGLSDSFTVLIDAETSDVTPASYMPLAGKQLTLGAANTGYLLYLQTDGNVYAYIADGSTATFDNVGGPANDTRFAAALRRSVSADQVEAFFDGSGSGSPATDGSTATLANSQPFTIGTKGARTTHFFTGKIYNVAVWPSALSGADLAAAASELQQRQAFPVIYPPAWAW